MKKKYLFSLIATLTVLASCTTTVNTPSPSSITAKVNGKETDDQITINAGEKLENISFEVLPSTTLQDVDVTLECIG